MRSPNRTHERQSFFKYMSAATANIVLANRTLRWSSPALFNDPFDVPRELSFGVTSSDVMRAIAHRFSGLIDRPPEDLSSIEPKLRLIIETVKNGISADLKRELLAGLDEVATTYNPTSQSMDALREMWRACIADFRILCLTESAAHAAMWFHYADEYQGVVLEFRCDDKLDSPWLGAKPVTYPREKPAVYTADGWAKMLTMPVDLAVHTMLDVATYTKAPDWSYENEWRITSFKRPTDMGNFTDYKFCTEELSGVYLGPMMKENDRSAIIALAEQYKDTRIWNVSMGMSREFNITALGQ